MDVLIEREIQKLIEKEIGDELRIKFILETLQNKKELYNSDKKYIVDLLEKHSDLEEINERLLFLTGKKESESAEKGNTLEPKTPVNKLHFQEKWCVHCKKGVFPERKFSVGALVILLLIGILPGLLYYALVSKVCPICSRSDWSNNY